MAPSYELVDGKEGTEEAFLPTKNFQMAVKSLGCNDAAKESNVSPGHGYAIQEDEEKVRIVLKSDRIYVNGHIE